MNIEISAEQLQKQKIMIATPAYGGMMTATYTKSMIELSILLAQYGVPFQVHYLSNESLIPRARNYAADEFMRSDCTHLMFIDADIGFDAKYVLDLLGLSLYDNKYAIITGPYPKKCLSNKTSLITEDGIKTIDEIVTTKYSGKVKSMNSSNKIVWNKVTNHWKEENTRNKKWVGLSHQTASTTNMLPRSKVVCTDDHEIAYIDDLFEPVIKYTEAKNMQGKYMILFPKEKNHIKDTTYRDLILNKDQMQVVLANSLCDGFSNGEFRTTHPNQIEYSEYISNILGVKNDGKYVSLRRTTQLEYIKELVGVGKARTLKNAIEKDLITPLVLAFMYMDDGSRYFYPEKEPIGELSEKSWWTNIITGENLRQNSSPGPDWKRGRKKVGEYKRATSDIFTMKYSEEDNQLLSEYLYKKYNIETEIRFKFEEKVNKKYYYQHLDAENTDKLHKLIHPYICESMEYKLNEEYRGLVKYVFNNKKYEFSIEKVERVVDVETDSCLYDIEVENDHNFFTASGVLVHNCISWEKIKLAVDKGLADKNPADLEKYAGDFVINIGKDRLEFRGDEPIEVMEAGTGFMMIPRSTLETFRDAYPWLSYKPDHARTENFNGSREITAFFDCPIDRGYKFGDLKDIVSRVANGELVKPDEAKNLLDKEDTSSKRYLSEDYAFCQYARDIGLKTWLCPWQHLTHTGTYIWNSNLLEVISIGASPTV